jgi:single-stranded DNA-binding protein
MKETVMNAVTVSGRLDADPVVERFGDVAIGELRVAAERPAGGPSGVVRVTCFGGLAVLAADRLAVGDHIGVTGWLRTQPEPRGDGSARQRVVAERLDFLGHPMPETGPDAHLEAACDDRYELDEAG